MGRPASCKIESWRVKVVSFLDPTPPRAKVCARLPLFCWAAPLRLFLTESFVTKYPICLIVACASSWLEASTTSLIS